MAKISIVIPVYNAENTITHCIKSIKEQTFADWHIIIVDDGSKDSSSIICDSMSSEKITVIHKTNGGVSSARNIGLRSVNTPYLTFCDSDDFLQPSYLNDLYNALLLSQADVVISGYTKLLVGGGGD